MVYHSPPQIVTYARHMPPIVNRGKKYKLLSTEIISYQWCADPATVPQWLVKFNVKLVVIKRFGKIITEAQR